VFLRNTGLILVVYSYYSSLEDKTYGDSHLCPVASSFFLLLQTKWIIGKFVSRHAEKSVQIFSFQY